LRSAKLIQVQVELLQILLLDISNVQTQMWITYGAYSTLVDNNFDK